MLKIRNEMEKEKRKRHRLLKFENNFADKEFFCSPLCMDKKCMASIRSAVFYWHPKILLINYCRYVKVRTFAVA